MSDVSPLAQPDDRGDAAPHDTVPRPQIDDATMLADLADQIRRYVRSSLRTSTRKHQPFGYVTARRSR